jgi:hypothetical protein
MRTSHKGPLKPYCIVCTGEMVQVVIDSRSAYHCRYEKQTFECADCGNRQTYTGADSQRRTTAESSAAAMPAGKVLLRT